MWKRTVEEYRRLGYYCPAIICDKTGKYPTVSYEGHKCIAYAEEYSRYRTAEGRMADSSAGGNISADAYEQEIWTMTAKIAARHFDYTEHPSAYCLFDTFSELEKNTARMLYRCLKPLFFTKIGRLRGLKDDWEAVRAYLDETERALTEPIDFSSYMG